MPVLIPVTPAGERRARVDVGPERFVFRTYFVHGQDDHWLLDIYDEQERPLITGINLVPGVDNLLKGHGNVLDGYQLHLAAEQGSEKRVDAPGNTMILLWFNPGEINVFVPGDPMDTIGDELWTWPEI